MDYLEMKSFELLDETVTLKNNAETFQMLLDMGWKDVSEKELKEINRAGQIDKLYPLSEYKENSCKRFFKANGCVLYFDYMTSLKLRVPRGQTIFVGRDRKVPKLFLEAYPQYSYIKDKTIQNWFKNNNK